MPNHTCTYLHVRRHCTVFRVLDHRVHLHLQLRRSGAVRGITLWMHRLGCGSQEEFGILFLRAVLELLSCNRHVSICDRLDYRVLVFRAFVGAKGVITRVQIILRRFGVSFGLYRLRCTYIMHFGHTATGLRSAASHIEAAIDIERPSRQRMHELLHKVCEMLSGMLLKVYSIYLPQRIHHDGDHWVWFLLVRTRSILPGAAVASGLCDIPWGGAPDNVLWQAADHIGVHLRGGPDDHPDLVLQHVDLHAGDANPGTFIVMIDFLRD